MRHGAEPSNRLSDIRTGRFERTLATTDNLRHIEWFHDQVRIESMLFDGALDPTGGAITPTARAAGHGMTLREERAATYPVTQ